MATIYVYSGATGLNNGTSWTDAYTDLATAVSAWTTSDVIYLASDHYEAPAGALTLASSNDNEANPVHIYSIDRSDDSYKPATSAQFVVGGADNTGINIVARLYGLYFSTNHVILFNPNEDAVSRYFDCTFYCSNTGGGKFITTYGGADNSAVHIFTNCTLSQVLSSGTFYITAYRSKNIYHGCTFSFKSPTAAGAFRGDTNGDHELYGCDLSGCSITTSLFFSIGNAALGAKMSNCVLPSSFSLITANNMGQYCEIVSSDSSGNLDRYEYADGAGNSIISTTSVYRDNGYNGVDNQVSYKISTASILPQQGPLEVFPIMGYISDTGSKTLTIELAHDYASSLTDTDVYAEVLYLGTASNTRQSLETSIPYPSGGKYDPVGAGTVLTTSSEVWTGGSGLTKQKLDVNVTINKAGLYAVRLYVRTYEASKFIYVDPMVSVA